MHKHMNFYNIQNWYQYVSDEQLHEVIKYLVFCPKKYAQNGVNK